MPNEQNLAYLIQAMEHFNNSGVNGLASSIGISNKTLKEFMQGNASKKTVKLVEDFIRQKMGAIMNLMDNYDNSFSTNNIFNNPIKHKNKSKYDHSNEKGFLIVPVYYRHKLKDGREIFAEGVYIGKGRFVMKQGATCRHTRKLESLPSKGNNNIKGDMLDCLEKGAVIRTGNYEYKFINDYETTSPSRALKIIRGHSINGKDWEGRAVKGKNISLNQYLNIHKKD